VMAPYRVRQTIDPLTAEQVALFRRPKLDGIGDHYGVGIFTSGRWWVLELDRDAGLRGMAFEEFEQGFEVATLAVRTGRAAVAACNRAERLASQPGGYDLFTNNCEHFARSVVIGKRVSKQSDLLLTLGLLFMAFAVVRLAR
jgi:hypothetical protein